MSSPDEPVERQVLELCAFNVFPQGQQLFAFPPLILIVCSLRVSDLLAENESAAMRAGWHPLIPGHRPVITCAHREAYNKRKLRIWIKLCVLPSTPPDLIAEYCWCKLFSLVQTFSSFNIEVCMRCPSGTG